MGSKFMVHIRRGKRKIGRGVYHFSIPRLVARLPNGGAVTTCPGATPWCRVNCYAAGGFFMLDHVKEAHYRNLLASLQDDFVDKMVEAIKRLYRRNRKKPIIVRLHVEGDFYSVDYIKKWAEIARRTVGIAYYYTYTRAWRIPKLKEAIERYLLPLPNFVVYASTDPFTGPPPTGWLEAGIEKTYSNDSTMCAHDIDKRITCDKCLYCAFGKGNVVFKYKPPKGARKSK